jgi:hypothetical protein
MKNKTRKTWDQLVNTERGTKLLLLLFVSFVFWVFIFVVEKKRKKMKTFSTHRRLFALPSSLMPF